VENNYTVSQDGLYNCFKKESPSLPVSKKKNLTTSVNGSVEPQLVVNNLIQSEKVNLLPVFKMNVDLEEEEEVIVRTFRFEMEKQSPSMDGSWANII
jgi:hypothetical protein